MTSVLSWQNLLALALLPFVLQTKVVCHSRYLLTSENTKSLGGTKI